MAALVPAIHAAPLQTPFKVSVWRHCVDGRNKSGHDGGEVLGVNPPRAPRG
jgi:hypothetical protein